jgi:hypothetical protein
MRFCLLPGRTWVRLHESIQVRPQLNQGSIDRLATHLQQAQGIDLDVVRQANVIT